MKHQLRPMLVTVMLICAPLAWSQSTGTSQGSTSGTSGDSQNGGYSTSSSQQGGYSTYGTPNNPQSAGQPGGQPNGTTPQPYVYQTYSTADQQQQSGSTDQTQSGLDQQVQNGSDDTTQGLGGPQTTFSNPEKLPPLNLFGDVISHTGLSFNTSVGTVAQYEGGYSGAPGYWDDLALVSAGVNLTEVRPNLLFTLGYNGGVSSTLSSTYGNYTNLNQTANAHIIWQFAKRWQFKLKDTYFYSDDPFSPFLTYLGSPQPNNPDPVLYFPETVVEQNQGTIDLAYRLGARDTLDFYGGESFQHYLRGLYASETQQDSLFSGLWNSVTYSGGVFYQHQFNPQLSAGTGYIFTSMAFGTGQSRAGVNMFQNFVDYKFNARLKVSGWIGPEITGTKDLVPLVCLPSGCLVEIVHSSYFNIAEGGTVTYTTARNDSFGLQATHSVTNGGGLFGAVNYYQATATYAHPLNRDWNLGAGLLYGYSKSVSGYNGEQYLKSLQGTVSASRKIGEQWRMTAYYIYIHQNQNYYGIYGAPTTLDTSGLGFTITYAWNHSLGR
jgi:hypothetical protein